MPMLDSGLSLHQRLAVVACAVSIDYDYYSFRAGKGGWLWPVMILSDSNDG